MPSAISAVLTLSLAAMSPLPACAEPAEPALGERLGGAVHDTIRPAYRLLEGVSDGVYDFVRRRVLGKLLPERMTRSLYAAPKQDSAALLDKNLSEKEARFLQRAREAYATTGNREWRSWAAREQLSVSVDALRDTLLQRYRLDLFGRSSEAYAKDHRNWNPGFLTMAGLVSGALLYLNGMHATAPLGDLRLAIDLSSGLRMQRAMRQGGASRRLAGLELGYKDHPLVLAAQWGVDRERLRGESVGLKYRLQF